MEENETLELMKNLKRGDKFMLPDGTKIFIRTELKLFEECPRYGCVDIETGGVTFFVGDIEVKRVRI